jgi:hypothetical protein
MRPMSLSLLFPILLCSCHQSAGSTTTQSQAARPGVDARLDEHWRQPSADGLGRCPFGHDHLREIPIFYGLLLWTPELHRQVDDLEVWPGGCVAMPWRTKVVCPTCRYAYEPGERIWEKSSPDPAAFARPLAPVVLGFPKPPDNQLIYYQDVGPAGPVKEQVLYWSAEDTATIEARTVRYLQERGIAVRRETHNYPGRRYVNLAGEIDDLALTLQLMYDGGIGKTCVHFSVGPS